MRAIHVALPFALAALPAACVDATDAAAEPKTAALPPPLTPGDLLDDVALARALREFYTKYEYKVPMRDGARLFTVVFLPKDRSRTYPMMMVRTPYGVGPYGADVYPNAERMRKLVPSAAFVRAGYIFVAQDVRGKAMSEGQYVDIRPQGAKGSVDESTDAFDTVEFLVKNVPSNNGRVGVWGVSYPGFYAAQAGVGAHPAVKAISPQAPVTDWFLGDDLHHNGALFLAQSFDFYSTFGKPRPEPTRKPASRDRGHELVDTYDFFLGLGPLPNVERQYKGDVAFWTEMSAHGTLDAYWKARDARPRYRAMRPAVMTVGGFFDAEDLYGTLETYRTIERQNPGADNTLVMGPWDHGGWRKGDADRLGDVAFGSRTGLYFREAIEFPFFDRYLRGAGRAAGAQQVEAWIFETGTNEWHAYPSWPPPGAKAQRLYFGAHGTLTTAAPRAAAGDDGADAYVSDPAKPVPYRGRLSEAIESPFMNDDQRFAARRPDVLVYSTGVLERDVTLDGPIEASLFVAVSGTDADFVVKLVDVFPNDMPDPEPNPTGVRMAGYQELIRAEVMRGKFRSSFERPEPFRPDEPATVKFSLPDVAHTFRSGHRIMVQVQSSWFPLVDRNPQTFCDIYHAKDTDFRTATHRVFRTASRPSSLSVTVARGALP